MKRTFSTELAYVFGIVFVARGVVLMEKADFGVSMVVAPAYLLYRWLSPVWSFVTFGMAEYCLQAVLLLAMCLLLRFRVSYLFSFVTAVVYGLVAVPAHHDCHRDRRSRPGVFLTEARGHPQKIFSAL